jgi:hypothetical protein
MNRVVLKHYPASKLPKDMRGSFDITASVEVVIVEEEIRPKTITVSEFRKMRDHAMIGRKPVTTAEAAARIRELRDEWDD